jgi:Spy/CpxP family protein refolding chaperone
MIHRKPWLFLLGLTLVFTSGVLAQRGPRGPRGPGAERVEQFKKIRMMEVLKLGEETSVRFIARYDKQQELIRDLASKRNDVIDQLEQLTKSSASDAEYEKAFKELRVVEDQVHEARAKYWDSLSEILTKKQLAQYTVFERNFFRDLRDIMRETQENRMGRGR